MGDLGVVLVPALGGYLFLTRYARTRDRISRQSGYHVAFQSAAVGLLLFAFSRTGILILNEYAPIIGELWKRAIDVDYSGTATLSVLLGWFVPPIVNTPIDRLAARRESARDAGDHIGLVVDEALSRRSMIAVTMAGGKVYVGVPLARTFFARGDGGDLVLVPFYSGYRDKDTHELRLAVNYAKVMEEEHRSGDLDLREYRVAMPMSEVVSAQPFNRQSYDEFAKVSRPWGSKSVA